MPRLNKRLDKNLEYYDLPTERHYVDYLIETDRALVIDNLIVDIPQIIQRRFTCHTDLCVGEKPVRNLRERSCCTSFDVRVAPDEIKPIEKILPDVRKRYPTIKKAIQDNEGEWWHYNEEDFNKTLEVKRDGGCIFLTPREDGRYKCGLHSICLEKGLNPAKHKPAACIMYPLFLVDVDDDILLTCTCEETRNVTDDSGEYHHFGCHCPNGLATEPLYKDMKGVLVYMFGEDVWKEIDRRARQFTDEAAAD